MIDPPPQVGEVALPELTADDAERRLVADPGKLMLVYFGYTSCPDFCPQSMSDAAAARSRLDNPESIQVAMVTVDPDRDLDNLADYVQAFFPDGIALGTDDPALLASAAAPFGATYSITENTVAPDTSNLSDTTTTSPSDPGDSSTEDGSTSADVTVNHTTYLYAVDDQGRLVMTWAYGTPISELTGDIEQYFEEYGER